MPNRRLTADELKLAGQILDDVRQKIELLSGSDPELKFAFNRKISKELTYDERRKPAYRRKLKAKKRLLQSGLCANCNCQLESGVVTILDRFRAVDGYTVENTRLLCQACDATIQAGRGYT